MTAFIKGLSLSNPTYHSAGFLIQLLKLETKFIFIWKRPQDAYRLMLKTMNGHHGQIHAKPQNIFLIIQLWAYQHYKLWGALKK